MTAPIVELLELMKRLRDPLTGCPWDREQTLESLVPHTVEEAFEVADVIERGELKELPGELGDLLFQVVFYAQIANEQGLFDFDDVIKAISHKLRTRHPHVFEAETFADVTALAARWEQFKAHERQARAQGNRSSELDDVPRTLPPLSRAAKLQKRAARVGFDWASIMPIFDKIEEELIELRQAVAENLSLAEIRSEVGDLLFAVVNAARHLGVDSESAVRGANQKFERRFRFIEESLAAQGRTPEGTDLVELDALWDLAKARGL
ncbi:MAG: nucleoside triphosphate pyrophosphohydrolase [Gammaproteobacteria bacterium]|nr:nucleoside triphosphate pyrophosphohydrolase [Gammaproteobacteria bacterium]